MATRLGVFSVIMAMVFSLPLSADLRADEDSLQQLKQVTETVRQQSEKIIAQTTQALSTMPDEIGLYSRRGDARFFAGQFEAAVSDYDRMVELDPDIDAGHWRRGIAYFYAGRYRDAAGQFERYHSFDNVDRENGIWRYLSQYKAHGREQARKGLLKYQKDDREPFPAVYELFAGRTTPEQILKSITAADISAEEREKRLFYAHLYIGLNEAVEDRPDTARKHLLLSVENSWGSKAGFGPHYMWQVGRLHALQLLNPSTTPKETR